MSKPIIEVRNLSKKYRLGQVGLGTLRDEISTVWHRLRTGKATEIANNPERGDFWALRDVSFEVQPGEIVGIIGRNGAGKSTLLKILSRITVPTSGDAILRGRVTSLLEVGTGFNPELTGRENIYLNGTILGMKRREITAKLDEIIAFAEITQHIDTPVKRYSSGMYVRLAFAVAAHLEPEILIVDEVLAVGDMQFQAKCLGKMQDVSRGGRTVLFVSHNLGAMQALCTKACYLQNGMVKAVGDVEMLIRDYQRDGNKGIKGHFKEPIKLGTGLELLNINFTPEAIICGSSIKFTLEFRTSTNTRINDLSLIIYSEQAVRLALLDLRTCGLPISLPSGTHLQVTGEIESVAFIEGDYCAGLYSYTDTHVDTAPDIARFTVLSRNKTDSFVPYLPTHRGYIELRFKAQFQ